VLGKTEAEQKRDNDCIGIVLANQPDYSVDFFGYQRLLYSVRCCPLGYSDYVFTGYRRGRMVYR
jgi:hypothetical protein